MVVTTNQGQIGPLTFPSLIQTLCGQKESGTLILTGEENGKTLYFDKGRVVFATSTDPEDRLGQLFLRRNTISLEILKRAAEVASSERKRIGTVLVQMKAIRSEELMWGVTEQVKSIVIDLFHWTRGEYTFKAGQPPSDEVITLKIPTADLVLGGIMSIEVWSRIEAAVGGLDTHYRTSPRLQELANEMTLSHDERTLVSLCESGPTTLGQMCKESALGDFDVCRLIWVFTVVGLLEREEEAQAGTAI